MGIKIACQCGQRFEAKERLAGKTLKCPKCGSSVKIPQPKQAGLAVACQCGQKFAAKAQLAGKTVECPKCGSPLKIPDAKQPRQPARPKPQPKPQQKQTPEAAALAAMPDPMGDPLDQAKLDGQSPPNLCPGCRVVMPQGAIVCVQCGYNQQLGRKMETVHETEEPAAPQGGLASAPHQAEPAKGSLSLVALGLNLILLGIVIICLMPLLIFLVAFVAPLRPLVVLAPLGMIGGSLLGIVGRVLCLSVPKASGAKELIIAAIIIEFAALGISVAEMVTTLSQVVNMVGGLLSLAATVTFLLFLKRLAVYLRRSDLAQRAQTLIAGGVCLLGILILWAFLFVVMFKAGGIGGLLWFLFALIPLAVVIMSIYLFVVYILLLLSLSAEIDSRIKG